ncbi:MAG: BaiN/RdsA family NAD(P)/FAD-dependent oxidoreductase [Armatimonadota bacterium]
MAHTDRVLVIGGGASGLMAAGTAAQRGKEVLLLERNRQLGRKLRIAGKGRCNFTNDADIDDLLANIPGNPRFLRHALYQFDSRAAIEFFANLGVPSKVERGGRVFPVSDDADDIANALERFCRNAGVTIQTQVTARRLQVRDGKVFGVETDTGKLLPAGKVILATGGASYPGTGSRGDGYRMAAEVGHSIIPIRPSLVPMETEERWPAEAKGLSLRNVILTAYTPRGKQVYTELGEMLLTHFGVSGPLILTASRHLPDLPGSRLEIDLKPGLDEEELDARILRDFEQFRRKHFANALDDLLPRSLIPIIVQLSEIPAATPVFALTRQQRRRLVRLLKHLSLTISKARPFSEAIVTAGGISTREIDTRTMESKIVSGLFFTGEVIDVDGYTGGFNLQIAWSTGRLAGESV